MSDMPDAIQMDRYIRQAAEQGYNFNRQARDASGSAIPMSGGLPQMDQWWREAQVRMFGAPLPSPGPDPAQQQVLRRIMQIHDQPLGDFPIDVPDSFGTTRPPVEFSAWQLLKNGWDNSPLGALQKWSAVGGAMHMAVDPTYDPFADPRLRALNLPDKWKYFDGSKSYEHTTWILGRLKENQRTADQIERMEGSELGKGALQIAGGLLGDPSILTPAMMGVSAGRLALKGAAMSFAEKAAFGGRHVALGALADGARVAGMQGALVLAQHALQNGMDPTYEVEQLADVLALPMVLGAATGTLVSGFRRWGEAADVLSRSRAAANFLDRTPAAGRAVPDSPEAAARPFGPDGVDPFQKVREGRPKGAYDVDPDVEAAIDTAVKAGDMDLARQLRKVSQLDPRDRALSLGALASIYDDIRLREAEQRGEISLKHRADFDQWMAGNKLVDAEGKPIMVFHGTTQDFERFLNDRLGSNTGAQSARLGHFFAGNPETAGAYAKFVDELRTEQAMPGARIRNPLWRRALGAPATREPAPVTAHIVEGEGANIRPTYLKMTNPYEVSDRIPRVYRPGEMDVVDGVVVVDVNGKSWKAVEDVLDSGDKIRLWQEIKEDGSVGGFEPEIMAKRDIRGIDYTSIIEQAKREGHDGVIIHETVDGGALDNKGTVDTVYVVFDPEKQIKGFHERWDVTDGPNRGGSLSAALSPGSSLYDPASQLAAGRLAPTGIGIENAGFDIISRAAQSPFTSWQSTAESLLASGGRLRVGNLAGLPSEIPVEIQIKNRWGYPVVENLRAMHDEWRAYREALKGNVNVGEQSDFGRIIYAARTRLEDMRAPPGTEPPLSFEAFRRRVGDALNNLDNDHVGGEAAQYINRVAAKMRAVYNDIRDEAQSVGLFRATFENQIAKLQSQIDRLKKEGAPDEVIVGAMHSQQKVREELQRLLEHGPSVSTAPSYRPRLWLVDQLTEHEAEFKDIVTRYYMVEKKLPQNMARSIADRVHDTLIGQKPFWEKNNLEQLVERALDPQSAMARTFEIPDRLVSQFLENDAEVLLRHHSRQMGTAIEMQRRFGSTDLAEQVQEIKAEAKKMAYGKSAEERVAIRKAAQSAIDDLVAARDRLYGVYGADANPHSAGVRAVRIAKQFSNITLLGMAGITALNDLIRPVMTEGLQSVHHYGFKTLMSEARADILKMTRRELELAGDGAEFINNVRALSASDTGDIFHSRTRFERGLNQFNQNFFILNGLNAINQLDKDWAGLIIQGNLNDIAMGVAHRGQIPKADIARLAAAGLDESMIKRIGVQLKEHGTTFNTMYVANTADWTDEYARMAYRSALVQMVNRTVPTPGIGDTPNFFSSPIGGLLSQYKSFAFGAMNRVLISGLQEGQARFWYGAAAAVGFAVILNEIRSRLFYDRSTFDRPVTTVIADGIDRAGVTAWFSDANRAIEMLSGNRFGARPAANWLTGNTSNHRPMPFERVVGQLGGPAAGQAATGLSVLQDFFSGHPVAKTWADARRLAPGNTLPFMDPVYDRLISDGSWHSKKKDVEKVLGRGG